MKYSEAEKKRADAAGAGDVAEESDWIPFLLERIRKSPSDDEFQEGFKRCLHEYEGALVGLLSLDLAMEEMDSPSGDCDEESSILVYARLRAQHTEAVVRYVRARTRLRVTLKGMRARAGVEREV